MVLEHNPEINPHEGVALALAGKRREELEMGWDDPKKGTHHHNTHTHTHFFFFFFFFTVLLLW